VKRRIIVLIREQLFEVLLNDNTIEGIEFYPDYTSNHHRSVYFGNLSQFVQAAILDKITDE